MKITELVKWERVFCRLCPPSPTLPLSACSSALHLALLGTWETSFPRTGVRLVSLGVRPGRPCSSNVAGCPAPVTRDTSSLAPLGGFGEQVGDGVGGSAGRVSSHSCPGLS